MIMTKIFRKIVPGCLAALFLILSSCSKKTEEAVWKAEVETVDGVKTVRNPAEPRYGEFVFNLVEDLEIGKEKDESRFFPRGAWLNVDGEGTMYVRDYGNKRIQVFAHDGQFLRSLGRIGQGPGEFGYPGDVVFDDEDRPYVRDSRRLVGFNRDGTFRENSPLVTFLSQMAMGPGGRIVGKTQPNPGAEGGPKNELVQLGPDGRRQITIAEFPVYGVSKDQVLMHWYTGDLLFSRRLDDSLYYNFSLEETIHVVDAGGRPLFAFSKLEERIPISAEESTRTRKDGLFAWFGSGDPEKADLGMPDHRPFYRHFYSDWEGRLYAVRFKPITESDTAGCLVDIFSKDGLYLYRATWPFLPQAMRSGFLYDAREDEAQGLFKVVRFKIVNWGDLKTE